MKYAVLFLVLLSSCANITPLTGGDKDVEAPKLLSANPSNQSIQFDSKEIVLEFDESIALNTSEKATLSPLNGGNVKTKTNRNKLIISMSDSLLPNTTYTIELNNVVKDLNEGNVVKQLKYSLSTGQNLDTLYIKGIVFDAISLKPIRDVMLALYDFEDTNDSALYNEIPKYVTKSLDDGSFLFSNLPKAQFALFALEDLDNNMRFSLPQERIGFIKHAITPITKSTDILLFDETHLNDTITPLVADSSTNNFGFLRVDSIPNGNIIAQLLKNEVVVYQTRNTKPLVIDSIMAGSYSLRIIFDDNENGQWDTGRLITKTLPEKIVNYKEPIEIRANWDLNLLWQAIE